MSYPQTAGYKVDGPSRESAKGIAASVMRDEVFRCFKACGPMTSDECALTMGHTPLAIRPRCSELVALGILRDSGQRAKNASGKTATVWTL